MSKLVLGGGLSGLSAAYYLSRAFPTQKVVLVESSNRLGGWIKSEKRESGVIFEQGPRTIRPRGDAGINTLNLVDELGLGGQTLPIYSDSPAAKNRMIYSDGKLYSLPSTIEGLFTTQRPFQKPLIRYLMQDLSATAKLVKDESIYDFTHRRFGQEVADYLISPMICGICAGNAKEVSVKFLMKTVFDYEQKYGTIIKGVLRHFFDRKKGVSRGKLASRAKSERWNVYSFIGGMETLPKTLESVLKRCKNVDIRCGASVNNLELADNDDFVVRFGNNVTEKYSHVLSCVNAQNLGLLVKNQHLELSAMLNNIQSVTVAVINLHYKGKLLKNEGFGFLVPPIENLPILGVIFDSCCYPYGDNTVLTVMMGGYWFKKHFGDDPSSETVLKIALKEVNNILGITEDPVQFKVNILENCIPQYVVGHNENVENIESYIQEHKLPLSLCGASYYGVGVNDVILSAKDAVLKLCR